jgi:hypothetical protein
MLHAQSLRGRETTAQYTRVTFASRLPPDGSVTHFARGMCSSQTERLASPGPAPLTGTLAT